MAPPKHQRSAQSDVGCHSWRSGSGIDSDASRTAPTRRRLAHRGQARWSGQEMGRVPRGLRLLQSSSLPDSSSKQDALRRWQSTSPSRNQVLPTKYREICGAGHGFGRHDTRRTKVTFANAIQRRPVPLAPKMGCDAMWPRLNAKSRNWLAPDHLRERRPMAPARFTQSPDADRPRHYLSSTPVFQLRVNLLLEAKERQMWRCSTPLNPLKWRFQPSDLTAWRKPRAPNIDA